MSRIARPGDKELRALSERRRVSTEIPVLSRARLSSVNPVPHIPDEEIHPRESVSQFQYSLLHPPPLNHPESLSNLVLETTVSMTTSHKHLFGDTMTCTISLPVVMAVFGKSCEIAFIQLANLYPRLSFSGSLYQSHILSH